MVFVFPLVVSNILFGFSHVESSIFDRETIVLLKIIIFDTDQKIAQPSIFLFQSEFKKQKEHRISDWNGTLVKPKDHPLLEPIGVYPYSSFFLVGGGTRRTTRAGVCVTKVVFTSRMLYSRLILPRVGLRALAGVSPVRETNISPSQ